MANKKVNQLTSKPAVNLTDLFLIADPTSGQAYKTTISDLGTAIGSGVSSVNGLVGAVVLDTDDIQELVSPTNKWFTDTRARAALSVSSPLTYNSGTGVFGIQVANGSQNGYLSSADWTTFNAKQAALSGTGFVKSTGGTISYDTNTYLTTSSAASTYLPLTGGTLTGALQVNGYLSAQVGGAFYGDVVLSGTNPRLYFTDIDNNPDYFISNTDGTFTVYDVTNSTARFTIGTTGNATFTNAITGGGSITGTALYSTGIVSVGTYLVLSSNNTIGVNSSYIGQGMADNDYWRIYGNTVASDQGEMVLHLGDNGTGISSGGQRFRFYIDNASGGTAKSPLIIDYDTSTFTTALAGTSATFTSGLIVSNTADVYPEFKTSASDADAFLGFSNTGDGNAAWSIGRRNTGEFWISTYTGNFNSGTRTEPLKITTSGAATFSSSVTAGGTGDGDWFTLNRSTVKKFNINLNSDWTTITSTANRLQLNDYTGGGISINGGNVGIGTTSPTAKLEVESKIKALNRDTTGFGNSSYELWAYNGSSVAYGGGMFQTNSTFAYQQIGANQTNIYAFQAGGMRLATGNAPIIFGTGNSDLDFSTERMRITSGGNVLINNTSDNSKGKLQVSGNTYTEGVYIETGAFSLGGGSTGTFFTFGNSATNRAFLITVRQQGSAGNSVTGMAFTYGASLKAYNIGQDNTNPVLYLTLSFSGLGLTLTTGSGYGTTTWEYTITQIK